MRQILLTLARLLSLVLCAATAVLWVRSIRALDEIYGSFGRTLFDVRSFNGRFEIRTREISQLRSDVTGNPWLLNTPRPFDSLVPKPAYENMIARQRWPLGETDEWQRDAAFFQPIEYRPGRLCWGRQGPGIWVWVREIRIPYWLPLVGFGIAPVAAIAKRFRRKPADDATLCCACGYDLRATPSRCPECGISRTLLSIHRVQ